MTRVQSEHLFFDCLLLEWIEYHLQLGVDHFYITDDCSPEEHALRHTLQAYIAAPGCELLEQKTTALKPCATF
jgi:hypothetical protein